MTDWRRLWKNDTCGDSSPPSCLKTNTDLASQVLASQSFCDKSTTTCGRSSECDSSDSSDSTFCWETLRRTLGALTLLLVGCGTFRRAAAAPKAVPLPFRSLFATPPPFLLAYVKAVFESHSLGICFHQSQRICMSPFYVAGHGVLPHPLYRVAK